MLHRLAWITAASLALMGFTAPVLAQASRPDTALVALLPERVWDGVADAPRSGAAVLVRGNRIVDVVATAAIPAGARRVPLTGLTLIPGLIEAHSHLLLHPYDETPWDEQVLRESVGLRVAQGVVHARATLMAGFTTVRDLGS